MTEPGNPQSVEERLVRLEEDAAFAQRAADELSAEIRLLNDRLREISRRVDGLESRLRAAAEGPDTPE